MIIRSSPTGDNLLLLLLKSFDLPYLTNAKNLIIPLEAIFSGIFAFDGNIAQSVSAFEVLNDQF